MERARALLDGGDLAGAVSELETLEGLPRQTVSSWLADAAKRVRCDAVLRTMSTAADATSSSSAASATAPSTVTTVQ